MDEDARAREFGKHLHYLRTEVFDESLRAFGARIGLSASYIGKLENARVSIPRRSTILTIAERLGAKPDLLLTSAGYTPDSDAEPDTTLALLFAQLDTDQQRLVRDFINLVRTTGARTPDTRATNR